MIVNKEIEVVFSIPANKRYEYFIKKVADYEEIWGLYNNGWAISEDNAGNKLIPFWPKSEFALMCANHHWENYETSKIKLEEFINEWLPDMKRDGIKPSIFYNNIDSVVRDIDDLLADLEEELENY
jgi:hypothetical protein